MYLIGPLRQENYQSRRSDRPGTTLPRATLVATLMGALVGAGLVQASTSSETPEIEPNTQTAPQMADPSLVTPDYSKKSDYELTELGVRWDDLSRPEKDALLREVKLRMAQRKDRDGVLVIRTQRRYGRIYRSDGRYLKIETKVVQVRPAPDQPNGFGVGFEQRSSATGNGSRDDSEPTAETAEPLEAVPVTEESVEQPPMVRINGPSQ